MRTPDEIKKGLKCCEQANCAKCPYYMPDYDCNVELMTDALVLIEEIGKKAARYDELCKRMKEAEFRMFVDKLAVYEKPETYEAAKKFCAEHLARFFLKEGAISFHKVYGVSIYDFLLEAKMQIVMPEPQKEE